MHSYVKSLALALLSILFAVNILPIIFASIDEYVHSGKVIDLSDSVGELWIKMAKVLIEKLYDPSLGLFRETWGTFEGRRWYWNTEQGEALQFLASLVEERTPLADEAGNTILNVFQSYRKYLTVELGDVVYPMTRYVSDGPVFVEDS